MPTKTRQEKVMEARRCRACDRVLSPQPGEQPNKFRKRQLCKNRLCFMVFCRQINQDRAEARQAKEQAAVERRREELQQKWRAELEAEGCVWTDSLD